MESDDDRLRYCFASALTGSMPGDDCPPPEELLAGEAGGLDPEAFGRLVDHLAGCPVCAEAWRLLRLDGKAP